MHHRRATDDSEVGNPRKIAKNLILDAVCEVSVLFFITQIFEGQYSDALLGYGRSDLRKVSYRR